MKRTKSALVSAAVKDGRTPKVPAAQRAWTLVFRRADQIWRQRLQRPAHAVLAALAAGEPFGKALERAAGEAKVTEFAGDGLFVGIDLPRRRSAK